MKWVTDSHFSSIPCISNIYAKENKWAEKHWVGLCFTFNLGFSLIKLLGENVNWGRSRPVSVRWVILCGGSGYSQSKPPATSRGQCRSATGPGEKWKKHSRLNSSTSMTGVFLCFCFSSLLKSLLATQGDAELWREESPWWHSQMTAFDAMMLSRHLHPDYLGKQLKCCFGGKK